MIRAPIIAATSDDYPYILIHGDPIDGFTFVGPFASREDAIAHAEDADYSGDWWFAPLVSAYDKEDAS